MLCYLPFYLLRKSPCMHQCHSFRHKPPHPHVFCTRAISHLRENIYSDRHTQCLVRKDKPVALLRCRRNDVERKTKVGMLINHCENWRLYLSTLCFKILYSCLCKHEPDARYVNNIGVCKCMHVRRRTCICTCCRSINQPVTTCTKLGLDSEKW